MRCSFASPAILLLLAACLCEWGVASAQMLPLSMLASPRPLVGRLTVPLDRSSVIGTTRSCEFQVVGTGTLLVNFLDESGQVMDTLFRFVAAATTLVWEDTFSGLLSTVTLGSLSGFLVVSQITLNLYVSTAWEPNTTYSYGLTIRANSAAADASVTSGFNGGMNVSFQLIGLPYSYELDRVMVALPFSTLNLTCTSTAVSSVKTNCEYLRERIKTFPDCFVTENTTTGAFVNVYVMGALSDTALEAAAMAVRLLSWDDGELPSNSSIVQPRGTSDWTSAAVHPRMVLPIRRRHTLHPDGRALLRTRGIQPPSDMAAIMPCIEVRSEVDTPRDSWPQDNPSDRFNSTTLTCFDPSLGPTWSFMDASGSMKNQSEPSAGAPSEPFSEISSSTGALRIHPQLPAVVECLHLFVAHDGVVWYQSRTTTRDWTHTSVMPAQASRFMNVSSVELVANDGGWWLQLILTSGNVARVSIPSNQSLAEFVADSTLALQVVTSELSGFHASHVASGFSRPELNFSIPLKPHKPITVVLDTLGFLHAQFLSPSINGSSEPHSHWLKVHVQQLGPHETSAALTDFRLMSHPLQPDWVGIGVSHGQLFLLKELPLELGPHAGLGNSAHCRWRAEPMLSDLRDHRDIWSFDIPLAGLSALPPVFALAGDGQLVMSVVADAAVTSSSMGYSPWQVLSEEVTSMLVLSSPSPAPPALDLFDSTTMLLFLARSGRTHCMRPLHQPMTVHAIAHGFAVHRMETTLVDRALGDSSRHFVFLYGAAAVRLMEVRTDCTALLIQSLDVPRLSLASAFPSLSSLSGTQYSVGATLTSSMLSFRPGVPAAYQSSSPSALMTPSFRSPRGTLVRTRLLPPGTAQFDYLALSQLPSRVAEFNFTDAQQWLRSVVLNDSDTQTLFRYRTAVTQAGESGVNMTIAACETGGAPAFYTNENVTAVVLGPLVDLRPPAMSVSPFLFRLATNASLPLAVRATAIRQSWSLPCPDPSLLQYLRSLSLLFNVSGQPAPLYFEAVDALSMFSAGTCNVSYAVSLGHSPDALASVFLDDQSMRLQRMLHIPCPGCNMTDTRVLFHTALSAHIAADELHLAELLLTALGNVRHPDDALLVKQYANHASVRVRAAAAQALRRFPLDTDTVQKLFVLAMDDRSSTVRSASLRSLHHISERTAKEPRSPGTSAASATMALVTRMIVDQLPSTAKHWEDLRLLRSFLQHRVRLHQVDRHVAAVGLRRVHHVLHATSSENVFKTDPLGTAEASLTASAEVGYTFDSSGFASHAWSSIDGALFGQTFNLAKAGVYAAWTSGAAVSANLYFTIRIWDPRIFSSVDYDVMLYSLYTRAPVGISAGDLCDLSPPPQLAYSTRIQKTFFQFTYYYGVPLLADVDIQVQGVGWLDLSYGLVLVFNDTGSALSFGHMAVKGYVVPSLGIDVRTSANVNLLVLSGGVSGTLTFADVSAPFVSSYNTATGRLGYTASLHAVAMRGSLDLYWEVFNCQCWSCSWSCCFRCGGQYNTRSVINIASWAGFSLNTVLASACPCTAGACMSADSDYYRLPNASVYLPRVVAMPMEDGLTLPPACCTTPPANYDGIGLNPVYNAACRYCGEPDDDDPCFGSTSDEPPPMRLHQFIGHTFPHLVTLPGLSVGPGMTYDCSATGYPEVCSNTACYFTYALGVPLSNIQLNRQKGTAHRSAAMSSLTSTCANNKNGWPTFSDGETAERDEVPMNSWQTGGACARLQAITKKQNARHGRALGNFYGVNAMADGDPFTVTVPASFAVPTALWCCEHEFHMIMRQTLETRACPLADLQTKFGNASPYGACPAATVYKM